MKNKRLVRLCVFCAASFFAASVFGNSQVVIDYMVLYTPAAEESIGGESNMLAKINSGVETVNRVLTNSGLSHISYRLVHVQRLNGNNTSIELNDALSEIYQLQPDINEIREEYFADSLSIIFERLSPGAYGTIPTSASQAKRSMTYFGVANYGSSTTSHELGHNMGGFHDNPEPDPGLKPENCSERYSSYAPYGYTFIGTNGVHYKTIMSAYYFSPLAPTNDVVLKSCEYYSNPLVNFQGTPTGKAGYADMGSEIEYWAPIIASSYTPPEIAPIYRFYSSGAAESTYTHLWTINETEKDVLNTWPSWQYEGIAWYAYNGYAGATSGVTSLYRLYEPNIKRHLYTISEDEYSYLNDYTTWQGENTQYYVYPTNLVSGLLPAYRFYNTKNQNHHFTIDENEKNTIISTPEWGYNYEGIGFYVFATNSLAQIHLNCQHDAKDGEY